MKTFTSTRTWPQTAPIPAQTLRIVLQGNTHIPYTNLASAPYLPENR